MRTRSRIALVVAVGATAVLAGFASGAATGTRLAGVQAYYGKTTKGLNVRIVIRGNALDKDESGIEAQWCTACANRLGTALYLDNDVPLTGNRFSLHRVYASGRIEQWLEARREQGGRVITGWARYADHHPGYTPKDTGKVSFTARLWASTEGAEWSGKTSDGKPLTVLVGFRSLYSDLPLTVADLSRQLTCRQPGGDASTLDLTIPKIEGVMDRFEWWSFRDSQHPAHTYPGKPARGAVTTEDGISVQASLTVSRLAPKGDGLAATGTLELAGAGCDPLTTTFSLRPR